MPISSLYANLLPCCGTCRSWQQYHLEVYKRVVVWTRRARDQTREGRRLGLDPTLELSASSTSSTVDVLRRKLRQANNKATQRGSAAASAAAKYVLDCG